MTDNAWAYRYSLRTLCAQHGIRQKFIKPHCPWQNGKVERLNRTLQTEWAYRQVFTSNDERATAHSADYPQPVGCDQPISQVHLAHVAARWPKSDR